MTFKEVVAASGIIFTLIASGVSWGNAMARLERAEEEIELLRQDLRAINTHFILYAQDRDRGQ